MRKYKFSYEDLTLSLDEFRVQFLKEIVKEYKIPKKKLDEIYSNLINTWDKVYDKT